MVLGQTRVGGRGPGSHSASRKLGKLLISELLWVCLCLSLPVSVSLAGLFASLLDSPHHGEWVR